jgi:3-hydroxy-9,10-secoandrosta-1,3,5(10)-triene-9,17-dione monooxygenase
VKLEEVTEIASSLVPALRERALATEQLRRLPDETLAELRASGLLRIVQPARWGGHELEPVSVLRASAELGRGCGSTAWCLGVLSVHSWMLGLYEERAQQEVWGDDSGVLLAASFAPTGQAERTADGIRLSGRWSFASGCDHVRWVMLGALVLGDGPPEMRMCLVPDSDYRIEDNWHVAGLAGTGSKDIVIEEALIPDHRALSLPDAFEGRAPGALNAGSALLRVPFGTMLLYALAGPALGLTRGAAEAYAERARTRLLTYTLEKQAEQAPAQVALGESLYDLDAVELIWERDLREVAEITSVGGEVGIEQRARYKRNVGLGLRTCQGAVDRLFALSGAHGLFDASPIQRAFRDVHAMSAHAALDPIDSARVMGRVALGLEPNSLLM